MEQSRTRGVSPVIAVILLVAITVTLSAVIGGFALDLGQQTTDESSQQEVGVSTSHSDGQVTATVVTGSADEVNLLVNGTQQASITNVSAGDSVSANASAGDDVTVVTVSDGSSSVVTSETVSETPSSSDSTTTPDWTLLWSDSFEDDASGSEPDAWNITSDGSTGGITVSTNWASNGSQSMRSYQPNTGAPSHLHATRPTTVNESNVRVTFDVYITGKENTGSADAFSVGAQPKSADQGEKIQYRVNFVHSGSSIAALNGTSWETMDSYSTNTKYHVVINADYSTDTYTVELNGVSHGPFNFYNESQPSEANYIHHRNDNYNGYLDNFTVEQSP